MNGVLNYDDSTAVIAELRELRAKQNRRAAMVETLRAILRHVAIIQAANLQPSECDAKISRPALSIVTENVGLIEILVRAALAWEGLRP